MRTNLPVNQNEILLDDEMLIVSKTDLKGRISYVNKDFMVISGFTEKELIGEPHNILRHPDMPVEAFEDLWKTLKEGRPWTGMVKNRCKNGDYYWVVANVTPIKEGGQITGYMSVRRKATRDAIRTHEEVYRLFREKRQGRLTIRCGKAVKGHKNPWAVLSIGMRMTVVLGFLCFALVLQGLVGIWTVAAANQKVAEMYEQREEPVRLLGRISKLMAESNIQVLQGLQHDPNGQYARFHEHPLTQHTDQLQKNIAEIDSLWESYQASIHSEDQRALAKSYQEARKNFMAEGLLPARQALLEGHYADANQLRQLKINPLYKEANGKAEEILKYLADASKTDFIASKAHYEQVRLWTLLVILCVVGLAIIGAVLLIRSIKRPVRDVVSTLENVSQGKYSNVIDVTHNDELGKALQGLQSMQTRLGFEVAEAKRIGDEMTRIKIALDNVSTPVRLADMAGHVIYANQSLLRTLRRIEPTLKAQNAAFSVDGFIGSSIGTLYADPEAALKRLAGLVSTTETVMDIGGRTYRVMTSPVLNAAGERLGSVGEWLDRTDQMLVEKEISEIVESAGAGVLDKRIDPTGKEGFFLTMATGINSLLGNTQQALLATSEVLSRVAQGDLTKSIDADYAGIFGQLKEDTNSTIQRLNEVIGQIKDASDTINTASKEIAAGNSDLSQRTEVQASSLEETASSMEELTSTVKQNAENAKQANQLAIGASGVAKKGGAVVGQVVSTMDSINESSRKIVDIISVIDGIAFQTNILALNAAVEAARAGEQGRGFAVVAGEVRNLAQRSAAAAKEIKVLISDSVEKVGAGTKLVSQAGQTMDEIVDAINHVTNIMSEITAASFEQSQGIEQVNSAITQMDEVTQQNAALVEEAAAAAESLEEQAQNLLLSVGTFKIASGSSSQRAVTVRTHVPAVKPVTGRQLKPKMPLQDKDGEWAEF